MIEKLFLINLNKEEKNEEETSDIELLKNQNEKSKRDAEKCKKKIYFLKMKRNYLIQNVGHDINYKKYLKKTN